MGGSTRLWIMRIGLLILLSRGGTACSMKESINKLIDRPRCGK